MKISFSIACASIALTDDTGKEILSYQVKEIDFNADPAGLINSLQQIQEQVEQYMDGLLANDEIQNAIDRAFESTKQ